MSNNVQNGGSLDRLEKKLDSRTETLAGVRRSQFSHRASPSAKTGWERPHLSPRKPRRIPWAEVAFIGSVVFFILAGVFAAFLFFSGTNSISTRNVTIDVEGPPSMRAGDTMSLQVVITNHNTVPMELADLVIEFPSGTRAENDISVELPRLRESLGTIEPGKSVNKTIRAIIFGSANTEAKTTLTVEYRVPSSNAIFYGEAKFETLISQSPASVEVGGLNELTSGQEAAITVTVTSNVQDVLRNVLLIADYPPGYTFVNSSPEPYADENVWKLGDIEAGGKRIVTIRGSFSGEDGAERVIKFETGSEKVGAEAELAVPLAAGEKTVTLTKPFVSASLALGGTITSEYIAERGTMIRGDIRYTNNLPGRVQDVEIVVSLNGAILDKTSVKPERGFYNSSQNIITWDKETYAPLADLAAGASDVLTFSLAPLSLESGVFRNPEIILDVSVRARRISESNVPETVESKSRAKVIVSTDLALTGAVTGTSGPVPPQVDQPTTYTVQWTASNTSNAVANASASAVLPSYAKWAGSSDGAVSFNAVGGIVTWNIGDLAAGQSKTASFSVTATPSISQVGSTITIVGDQRIYGLDRFTQTQIERVLPALRTVGAVKQ